jgi:hypothetical protein
MSDLTRFSIESTFFRRANPDNTPATPARNIGFTGTINSDVTPFLTNAVDLTIKIGSDAEQNQSVDFVASPPLDTSAVTVAEAVIAINAAGFTDITDAEEVENEAGDGTLVVVRRSEKVKGSNLVYTAIDQSNSFLNLVMGGTYDPTTDEFTMPTVLQTEMPKVTIEDFIPQYEKGSHLEGSTAGFTRKKYYITSGVRGDEANEAAALAEGLFNFAALQWSDENGVLQGHQSILDLTNEEFENLDLENLST